MYPRLDCVPRARFGVPPRSYATWTAADQRTERGSCALLNINAGENKCDPLSSSPPISLHHCLLSGILLPALPAASAQKRPVAVAAEQEESQSKIPGAAAADPSSPLPSSPPLLSRTSCRHSFVRHGAATSDNKQECLQRGVKVKVACVPNVQTCRSQKGPPLAVTHPRWGAAEDVSERSDEHHKRYLLEISRKKYIYKISTRRTNKAIFCTLYHCTVACFVL